MKICNKKDRHFLSLQLIFMNIFCRSKLNSFVTNVFHCDRKRESVPESDYKELPTTAVFVSTVTEGGALETLHKYHCAAIAGVSRER